MNCPPYSFVIPVLNEEGRIGPLLQRLAKHFPRAELIVVDGGSADGSVAEAQPLCSAVLRGMPGRAAQMNLGAEAASGQYLLFLHADSWPKVTVDELETGLAQRPLWGFCRIALCDDQPVFRLIEAAMNLRSRLTRVATGDQMIFAARQQLADHRGFAAIPLMEDIELCKRLRRHCPPLILSAPVETSTRRWREGGVAATVLRMWALRLAYFLGVKPQRLWQFYYGS